MPTLQERVTDILKATRTPLKAGAIRAALNTQPGATPVTKSDVNKVVYGLQRTGVTVAQPSDDSGAPLWDLCPELKNEPEASVLEAAGAGINKDENSHPEPMGRGSPQ